jgi:hypothetical protein
VEKWPESAETVAGSLVSAIIRDERQRAAILSACELVGAVEAFAFADRMLRGPVARRGARSHGCWRRVLAGNAMLEAAMRGVSSALYSSVAGKDALAPVPKGAGGDVVTFVSPGRET